MTVQFITFYKRNISISNFNTYNLHIQCLVQKFPGHKAEVQLHDQGYFAG